LIRKAKLKRCLIAWKKNLLAGGEKDYWLSSMDWREN